MSPNEPLVGLLGGAFDPPHEGHLALARAAIARFALERLLVVVTGEAPHKAVETDPEVRYRLAEAAFGGAEGIELSRHELDRPGPSYTVETARWAHERFGEAIFLVGADEFAGFLRWHDPDGVLEHVRLGVATRPGYRQPELDGVLAALAQPERVTFFDMPEFPVASRELRARIARGQSIEGLVPPAVAVLVAELGLYRAEPA
jgi:nicotinate-nucleotide adenylyltransferase